ncbi:uncharacterized protein LOC117042301 [Lacerta agilis]|uniref:uncharacterized protein LOC117042301 n=1 Tax=Lacerta agilis TaxID=80427 RepID=UPI001419C08E|nr:uncharacterized protein LOC117042301 [Lacerta agilis]
MRGKTMQVDNASGEKGKDPEVEKTSSRAELTQRTPFGSLAAAAAHAARACGAKSSPRLAHPCSPWGVREGGWGGGGGFSPTPPLFPFDRHGQLLLRKAGSPDLPFGRAQGAAAATAASRQTNTELLCKKKTQKTKTRQREREAGGGGAWRRARSRARSKAGSRGVQSGDVLRSASLSEEELKEAKARSQRIAAQLTTPPSSNSKGVLLFHRRKQRVNAFTLEAPKTTSAKQAGAERIPRATHKHQSSPRYGERVSFEAGLNRHRSIGRIILRQEL